jgi:ATP-dependent protease ClpP protease subunit
MYDPESGIAKIVDIISPLTLRKISDFVGDFSTFGAGHVSMSGDIRPRDITIELMSPGGCIRSALSIYDYLTTSIPEFVPVTIIVAGHCGTASSIILCAAKTRVAMPNSMFIISKRTIDNLNGNINELNISANYLTLLEEEMKAIFSNTFNTKDILDDRWQTTVIMRCNEALSCGMINKILNPPQKKVVKKTRKQ